MHENTTSDYSRPIKLWRIHDRSRGQTLALLCWNCDAVAINHDVWSREIYVTVSSIVALNFASAYIVVHLSRNALYCRFFMIRESWRSFVIVAKIPKKQELETLNEHFWESIIFLISSENLFRFFILPWCLVVDRDSQVPKVLFYK